jgi:hypothetical protein
MLSLEAMILLQTNISDFYLQLIAIRMGGKI